MATQQRSRYDMQSSFLAVPNEVIFQILGSMSAHDLRHVGRTNKRLRILSKDQLRRINGPFFSLYDKLILKIAQDLDIRNRTRLARVSHRYYPLIVDQILHQNIQTHRSSLLLFAVKRNLTRMAYRLLIYGADVNTQYSSPSETLNMIMSPLTIAACSRHLKMVNLLLDFRPIHCSARSLNRALHCVLTRDSKRRDFIQREAFVKRELHQDVYKIVLMLLQRGADPDAHLDNLRSPSHGTARMISSRHPDPRIRALLMVVTQPEGHKKYVPQVGRLWAHSLQAQSHVFQHNQLMDSCFREGIFVRLGDFFERSNAEEPMDVSSGGHSMGRRAGCGSLGNMKTIRPPPLSSFPPLNTSESALQCSSHSSQYSIPLTSDLVDPSYVHLSKEEFRRPKQSEQTIQ